MEDEKKLDEMLLDTAVLVFRTEQHLYKKGIIAFWPVAFGGAVQVMHDVFMRLFSDWTVETYPAEDGEVGKTAVAFYHGIKFFTFLREGEK